MSERVVVVTGASAGIGRATARAFARRGDAVSLLARGGEGLHQARREAEAHGARALAIPTDVADHDQVEAAAAATERDLGQIDVWVNNDMTTVFAPFAEIDPAEYRRATEVTYLGTVYGTMAALRRMKPSDRGSIVQVGSALAYRGIPLQAPYCAQARDQGADRLTPLRAATRRQSCLDRPVDPDRADNLFEPVDDDRDLGAHGDFDHGARGRSLQLWFTRHRSTLTVGTAAAPVVAMVARSAR